MEPWTDRECNGVLLAAPRDPTLPPPVVFPLRRETGESVDLGWGGPFAHCMRDGVCTVCGYDVPFGYRGCPHDVDMETYRPGRPLGTVGELRQALAALRAETWQDQP